MKKLSLLGLLLKYEGYPTAVIVALLLHGVLLFFLLDRSMGPADQVAVEPPTHISASVIEENPQRQRREQLEAEQRRAREAREQAEQQAREEARRQAEREAAEQAERERREQERAEEERRQRELAEQRAREEEERRAREEAERRERERQEQLARERAEREAEAAREAAARRAQEQAAAEARSVAAYSAVIHDTVARNWSIPPSARNGMSVLLRINLVPTGEVVGVTVLESSGDAAFDRSAVQAVRKAERFPELQDMSIGLFEREFRQFNLLFRPEDLLR